MPIDVSAASYIPGASVARGSVVSEPIIPAGRGGAGSGANGFASPFWLAGLVSGAFVDGGDGEAVCACVFAAKHEPKTTKATNNWKVTVRTRIIGFPLRSKLQFSLYCGADSISLW